MNPARLSITDDHEATSNLHVDGATFVQVDYTDKEDLMKHLHGVHTVLSFFLDTSDPK